MKKSLLSILGSFAFVLVLFAVLNGYFNSKLHTVQKHLVELDDLSGFVNEHVEWIAHLSNTPQLFDSIAEHESLFIQLNRQHHAIIGSKINLAFKNNTPVRRKFIALNNSMCLKEEQLIVDMAKIGFKEQGFIGEMRTTIHHLETSFPQYKELILSLRRHEKDFIMRQDERYSEQLHQEVENWKQHTGFPKELLTYLARFDSVKSNLAVFNGENTASHMLIWNSTRDNLQNYIRAYRGKSIQESYEISTRSKQVQLLVTIICLLILIAGSLFIIRNITNQVGRLQQAMSAFISSNYQSDEEMTHRMPKNEIGQISMHFIKMARKIEWDVQVLEDRVKRRTRSLDEQNKLLEIKHKEITESLRYARELQQSLLISKKQLLHHFEDVYIHYEPKNMVGGDFYWMKSFRENGHDKLLFAMADSTGHGVPGALLSVLGMNILDELFAQGIRQPHLLLNAMRSSILERLSSEGEKRMDGMDLALFCIDKKTNELLYSGAQMPVWVLREKILIELKGDRVPVGFTYLDHEEFELHHLLLKENDRIILFSDGIVDQFGMASDKKLGKKQLRYILQNFWDSDSSGLFTRVLNHFNQWKGDKLQTDDCTFIILEPQFNTETSSEAKKAKKKEVLV